MNLVDLMNRCASQKANVLRMASADAINNVDGFIDLAGAFAELQDDCNKLRRAGREIGIEVKTDHFDEDDTIMAVAVRLDTLAQQLEADLTPDKMHKRLMDARVAGNDTEVMRMSMAIFVLVGTDPLKFGELWEQIHPDEVT